MASPDQLLPEFRTRFPEFDSVSDALVLLQLGDALSVFNCNDKATLFLAAHYLTLDTSSGVGVAGPGGGVDEGLGVVASETVGKVSTSYKNASDINAKDAAYETTPYGRRFIQFRNSSPGYRISMRSF